MEENVMNVDENYVDENDGESSDQDDAVSEEIEEFDRDLPPSHSYLPGGMVAVRGRSILEPGWEGKVPCRFHTSVVFPGQCLPMICTENNIHNIGADLVKNGNLFGLICPDETGYLSNYGVLCEIIEVSEPPENQENVDIHHRIPLSFKALAIHRFYLVQHNHNVPSISMPYDNPCTIRILRDIVSCDPLEGSRSFSTFRPDSTSVQSKSLRKADAIVTPWPHFVYEIFDVNKIISTIRLYFQKLALDNLPNDILSLSYWVASNLVIPAKDHFELFKIDSALLRLYKEVKYLQNFQIYCFLCAQMGRINTIAKIDQIFAMSKDGLHSNYCNVGGYLHDVVTVKAVNGVMLVGRSSAEFSWFPGYSWTIANCLACHSHLGWKFTAIKKLNPREFWGLTRSSITVRLISEE